MWKLNALMGRCRDQGIGGIEYRQIYDETGVSTSTLQSIIRNRAVRLDLSTISRLLTFFSDKLGEELTVNDLLEWRREEGLHFTKK